MLPRPSSGVAGPSRTPNHRGEEHPEQVDEPHEGNGDSFIDDDEWQEADLVSGFSPATSLTPLPGTTRGGPSVTRGDGAQRDASRPDRPVADQWDALSWDAWDTPRGPTPGPEAAGTGNLNEGQQDILSAFERMTMAQRSEVERKPSPPIIDLRETERKLDAQRQATQPQSAVVLQPEDLDFFESFASNPRAVMAASRTHSREKAKLEGDQLHSMQEAQASPLDIHTPRPAFTDQAGGTDYFGTEGEQEGTNASSASPSEKRQSWGRGSWTEAAGGWAGSLRRTIGSIRGHLPSTRDFYVDDDDDEEENQPPPVNRRKTSPDPVPAASKGQNGGQEKHPHARLRRISDFSQGTPFSNHSDGSPTRPDSGMHALLHPVAGHHSIAPISGAPGFDPNAERNWNTGSWSLTSREEAERQRRPIPVALHGRREETQDVMDDALAAALTAHLPRRLQLGKMWKLLYSSDQDGISLGTLYHKVQVGLDQRLQSSRVTSPGATNGSSTTEAEGWLRGASEAARSAATGSSKVTRVGGGISLTEAGIVLAIKDDQGHIFGAFVNEKLRAQTSYYGNGECFLWKGIDDGQLRTFKWTGRNDYMVLTEAHYLSFGGGEGKYGLWLDGQLEKGVSSRCPAFDNEVLCDGRDDHGKAPTGTEEGRFECITLEVWACGID